MSAYLCSSLEHDKMSLMMDFFQSSLSLFQWRQPVIAWIRNSRLEFINIPLSKCAREQKAKHYIYLKSDTGFNSSRPSDAYMRRKTNHHWFRWWLVAWTAPSHYLNHCWNIVNWALGNNLQWNFNPNSNIFIHENAFENVVSEMASICLGLNVLKQPSWWLMTRV